MIFLEKRNHLRIVNYELNHLRIAYKASKINRFRDAICCVL